MSWAHATMTDSRHAGGTSGSTLRLGVFDSHSTSGLPHTVLADQTAGSADTTGAKSASISLTLDPGLYWLAAVIQWASVTVEAACNYERAPALDIT